MGNATGGGLSLRSGKRGDACSLRLAANAKTWDEITNHPDFRREILVRLSDEGLLRCLFASERDALTAAVGHVEFFKGLDGRERGELEAKVAAWRQR
ncbi:unnamed protein product, partial [Phaeothamnion confervicola]